jgi:hypothetical protein
MRDWGIALRVLNLGTVWSCMVAPTPLTPYHWERPSRSHWIGGWFDTRAGLVDLEKTILTLLGMEPRLLGRWACSPVTIRNELSWLYVLFLKKTIPTASETCCLLRSDAVYSNRQLPAACFVYLDDQDSNFRRPDGTASQCKRWECLQPSHWKPQVSCRLRAFEKRVMRRTFRTKEKIVDEEWRKIHPQNQ